MTLVDMVGAASPNTARTASKNRFDEIAFRTLLIC